MANLQLIYFEVHISMSKLNINVNIAGLHLRNPTMLAAGVLGLSGDMLKKIAKSGAGAVVTKSVGIERCGYTTPNVLEPIPGVVLNAMGLPNPGCEEFQKEIPIAKKGGVPVIVSIFGFSPEEFESAAIKMEKAGADMLELNISCPHSGRHTLIGQDPKETYSTVKAVKEAVKIPVMVKLTPNVTDIAVIAKSAIDAGVDAISAINTLKALYIDVDRGGPLLSNKVGGMSGPAIKPIAVRCVAEIALLVEDMGRKIPIVGVGGVCSGRDVAEFLMAGACAVQIGTAILYDEIQVFGNIVKELREFMIENDYENLNQITGLALNEIRNAKSSPNKKPCSPSLAPI